MQGLGAITLPNGAFTYLEGRGELILQLTYWVKSIVFDESRYENKLERPSEKSTILGKRSYTGFPMKV